MTTNLDTITAFLRGKGLTAAQIAGVEGNLQTESGFSPTASNPKEGAIGIAQWEGGRRTALDAAAASAGTSETDLNTQLNFMWSELTGSEHGALASLLGQTTAAGAATVFDQQYERSSAASLPTRVSAANSLLAGGLTGGSGVVDTSGATAQDAGLLSGVTSGIWDGFLTAMKPLGRLIVDGFLILAGVGLLITAIILVAKGGDSADRQASAPTPAPSRGGETETAGKRSAVAEDAGEAAVVA